MLYEQVKLGVFGGSFNPIHMGHLIMAQRVLVELNLDKILFVPTVQNPFKKDKVELDFEKRSAMIGKAISSNPKFELEIHNEGKAPSYTIDTIKHLMNKYSDAQLYFICGVDNLMELHLWKDFDELAELCSFAFVNRNDLAYHYIEAQVEFLNTSYGANLLEVEAPNIQISSTNIRNEIAQGRSVKYFVPESIEQDVLQAYGKEQICLRQRR